MLIRCPSCQQSLEVEKEHYGQQVNCPNCNLLFIVPIPVATAQFKKIKERPVQTTIVVKQKSGCISKIFWLFVVAITISVCIGVYNGGTKEDNIEARIKKKKEQNMQKEEEKLIVKNKRIDEKCKDDKQGTKRIAYEIFGEYIEVTGCARSNLHKLPDVWITSELPNKMTKKETRNAFLSQIIDYVLKAKEKQLDLERYFFAGQCYFSGGKLGIAINIKLTKKDADEITKNTTPEELFEKLKNREMFHKDFR